MSNFPTQFWALAIMTMGAILAIVAYVVPGAEVARHDLFTLASSLASGGLGAFMATQRKGPTDPNPQP